MASKKKRTLEVAVSFDGLNKGLRFEEDPGDKWAETHLASGYLVDVTGVPPTEVPPAAPGMPPVMAVDEEVPHAGEVSKG